MAKQKWNILLLELSKWIVKLQRTKTNTPWNDMNQNLLSKLVPYLEKKRSDLKILNIEEVINNKIRRYIVKQN